MSFLRKYFDFALLALIIAGFLSVASQRLATVPTPDTDESYMLQTSYEMLYRGKLALPFRRFLGGNIENNWHSFTPLHYVLQSGFLKLFGWGIPQGRAFNLTMATLLLILVHLIGRKLFDWRVGLMAVIVLVCDVTFLERSRYLRNDYSTAMFALLAFLLYEAAERRKDWRLFVTSGLAAGAALMCHTAAIYLLAAITVLMLVRRGWRLIKAKNFYQFVAGAFVVSAYEIITDLLDWNNVLLQNRGDKRHFRILDPGGWWENIQREHRRYTAWYEGSQMYADVPRTMVHLFYYLTIIAIAYLIIRTAIQIRRGNRVIEARTSLLVVTVAAVSFFAIVAGQKETYYMVHLTSWFALSVGVLLADGFDYVKRLGEMKSKGSMLTRYVYRATIAAIIIVAGALSIQVLRQNRRYIRNVVDPNVTVFEEFKTAISSLVPEGVCPVVVREPTMWLAFPEHDRCFANIDKRMRKQVNLNGEEYALIVRPGGAENWLARISPDHQHLLGGVRDSPLGNFDVYYLGTDPRLLALEPTRYQFFGRRRGYTTEQAVRQAQDVLSADVTDATHCAGLAASTIEPDGFLIKPEQGRPSDHFVGFCSIDLKPETVYQLGIEATGESVQWLLLVLEDGSGYRLLEKRIGERRRKAKEKNEPDPFDGVFKTGKVGRIEVGALPTGTDGTPFHVSRIMLREVPPVTRAE